MMKKKVCAVLLAAALVIGMSATVLAEKGTPILPGGGDRPLSLDPCPIELVVEEK